MVQLYWQFPHVSQISPYCTLPLYRANDEQEAAAPGTGQLGAGCTSVERPRDRLVDLGIRHSRRQLPLGFPALAQCGTDCVHVAIAQAPSGEPREVAQEVELGAVGFDVCVLLGQDRIRAPGDAGVEEHDLLLESPPVSRGEPHLAGYHLIAGPEADVADPAECGNVLILLADGLSAAFDLDRASSLGKFFRRHLLPPVREQGVQQPDGDRGRGAKTGTRRGNVGECRDLHSVRHAGHLHGFPDELVLEILDALNDFLLGVVDVDVIVEALLDYHIDILVERAVEDPAAVLPVVAGQIGPATEQANSQGRLRDYHRAALTGHSSLARRYASAVPTSRKYPSTSTARAWPTSRGNRL